MIELSGAQAGSQPSGSSGMVEDGSVESDGAIDAVVVLRNVDDEAVEVLDSLLRVSIAHPQPPRSRGPRKGVGTGLRVPVHRRDLHLLFACEAVEVGAEEVVHLVGLRRTRPLECLMFPNEVAVSGLREVPQQEPLVGDEVEGLVSKPGRASLVLRVLIVVAVHEQKEEKAF